jgi:head-tail adaptor
MARDDHLDAGYFNKPIQIQTAQLTPDGSGGEIATGWTTVYKCFAHIDNFAASGTALRRAIRRPFLYMQLYPEMDSLISIRYQASIQLTPAMTILYKSRRYQILGLNIPHEELVTILIPVVVYRAPGTPG